MNRSEGNACVRNFKRRIKKKLDDIEEDVEYLIHTLKDLTVKLKDRTIEVVEDSSNDVAFYQHLYEQLDNFSTDLFTTLNTVTSMYNYANRFHEEFQRWSGNSMYVFTFAKAQKNVKLQGITEDAHRKDAGSSDNTSQDSRHSDTVKGDMSVTSAPFKVDVDVPTKESSHEPAIDEEQLHLQSASESISEQTLIKKVYPDNQEFTQETDVRKQCDSKEFSQSAFSVSSYHSVSSSGKDLNWAAWNINSNRVPYLESQEKCNSSPVPTSLSSFQSSSVSLASATHTEPNYENLNISYDIPEPHVLFGVDYKSAVVTSISNPSDFWMQLETPQESEISFLLNKKINSPVTELHLTRMRYFLAPSKRTGKYHRAKIVNFSKPDRSHQDTVVQVHFVDYGNTEYVNVGELKLLPLSSYTYPVQAVHCCLNDIAPSDEEWTEAAVNEFKNALEFSDLHAHVHGKREDKYQATLMVTVRLPDCVEMCNVSQILLLSGYARCLNSESKNSATNVDSSSHQYDVNPSCQTSGYGSYGWDDQLPSGKSHVKNLAIKTAHCSAVSGNEDLAYENGGCNEYAVHSKSDVYHADHRAAGEDVKPYENHGSLKGSSHSSGSRSSCSVHQQSSEREQFLKEGSQSADTGFQQFHVKNTCFDWRLQVQDAEPTYVQKSYMLVSVSAVINPSHFYVNIASESVGELDYLQEQLTPFYENCRHDYNLQVATRDLQPGMFCCCLFPEDNGWYRAKILDMQNSEEHVPKAVVQYIDYGNKGIVDVDGIRPLTASFASYPAFALACSLAGIVPKFQETVDHNENVQLCNGGWDTSAIERFRVLTMADREKCFTAQVVDEKRLADNRSCFSIILWDRQEGVDYMINDMLIDEGFAYLDPGVLPPAGVEEGEDISHTEALKTWDPLSDDFNSVNNSYGVDPTDHEVATIGYKANDEQYICKFFSVKGSCYRGDNCPYKHIAVDFGGETLDQEEVFLVEMQVPLPKPGSCCLAQVSHMIDPGHFYVVFPYGTDGLVNDAKGLEKSRKEFELLTRSLNEHYSKAPFDENTTVALAAGTIVAAKSLFDGYWYRARVVDVDDVDKAVEVFFVDYGGTESVPRRNIRRMKQEYLYCPLQATECMLANVIPSTHKWSTEARTVFINLVKGKVLLLHVIESIDFVLHVTLQGTSRDNDVIINNYLVEKNFAKYAPFGDAVFSDSANEHSMVQSGNQCSFWYLEQQC